MPINPRAGRAMTAGLLAAAALFGAAPSIASPAAGPEFVVQQQPSPNTHMVRVAIADLDLTQAHGQRTLELRVNRAARDVCQLDKGSVLDNTPSARGCVADARAGALAQLDARGYPASWAVSQVNSVS